MPGSVENSTSSQSGKSGKTLRIWCLTKRHKHMPQMSATSGHRSDRFGTVFQRITDANRRSLPQLLSGKTLAEKMRELGFNFRSERTMKTLPLHYINIKLEERRPSDYVIMTPNINLMQIVYFQPEIKYDENDPGKITYLFEDFKKNAESKEIKRISDIEVKSYKPIRKMSFRKKKRRSTIVTTVEKILHKYREESLSKEPSEESIVLEEHTERKKTIQDVPESLMLRIFKYFNLQERNLVLARVCKSWYYILNDPIFWTELTFTGPRIPKTMIIQLLRKHPSVRKLSLTSVPEVVDILQELCRCNHSITDLKVRHCSLSSQDFSRIILHVISCCTKIENLDLEGMRFQSDRFFLELGRLKNLKSLNITGNKLVKNHNLLTLSVNCRNLQELKILDIFVNNEAGSQLRDADLIYIALHLQNNLDTFEIDMQKLKTVSYQAILNCTNLTNLVLRNCLYLSREIFRQFPDLGNLKHLELTRGINLKPEDFQFVFSSENLSKIENLNIDGCWRVGEIGLQAITQCLPSLKSLSLKNCKTIEEHHLVHLSRCPELSHLNIAHTGIQLNSASSISVKNLESLVLDSTMLKRPIIQKLKQIYPSLTINVSYSEFKKIEKPLDQY